MKRVHRFSLIAVGVLLAVVLASQVLPRGDRAPRRRAVVRREIAMEIVGKYLADRMPGARTLVIGNPYTRLRGQASEVRLFEEAAVKGLKRGGRKRIEFIGVDFPELIPAAVQDPSMVPIPPDATTPLSFLTAEGAWDALVDRHSNTDVVVSLIGVPADLQRLGVWRGPKPHFALLLPDLRLLGETDTIVSAFRSGKLLAVVLNRPGSPPESVPVGRDPEQEFERRFLLVTADNCEGILRALPPVP